MAIAFGNDAVGGLHPVHHALSDELAKAPVGEGGGREQPRRGVTG